MSPYQFLALLCCLVVASTLGQDTAYYPAAPGTKPQTVVTRAWHGEFKGEVRLAVKYPLFINDWMLKLKFRRNVFDLDICEDQMELVSVNDKKRVFTFRKGPGGLPNMVVPSQPLHVPFLAKTWEQVRGLKAEIEFIPAGTLSPRACDLQCGSTSTSYSPTTTLLTVPVNFGDIKAHPQIVILTSVQIKKVTVLEINGMGLVNLEPIDNVPSILGDGFSFVITVNFGRFPLDFINGNVNMLLEFEFMFEDALENSFFNGVILWPFLEPSIANNCNCEDLDYKYAKGPPPDFGFLPGSPTE